MAETNTPETDKKMGGYRIATGILAAVLVVLSILYFNIHRQQQSEYKVLSGERDTIKENLTEIVGQFEELTTSNEELQKSMEEERVRTQETIDKLTKERNLNYSKLKKYEKELSSLRVVMRGYLQQIDSLNNLNQELLAENLDVKKQLTETELRAADAEELARMLEGQVREGSILVANGIQIVGLNKKGRTSPRIKKATQLSINFTIAANKLAEAGNKEIIACVTSPDGYVLTTEATPSFDLNGTQTTYTASREVEYQNTDLPVSIFFTGKGFVAGQYEVSIYNAGVLIGTSKLEMR